MSDIVAPVLGGDNVLIYRVITFSSSRSAVKPEYRRGKWCAGPDEGRPAGAQPGAGVCGRRFGFVRRRRVNAQHGAREGAWRRFRTSPGKQGSRRPPRPGPSAATVRSAPRRRERVLAAAAALGYRPNGLARSMITGSTQTLGVVLSDIENPFFHRALRGITDTARSRGYEVVLTNTDEDARGGARGRRHPRRAAGRRPHRLPHRRRGPTPHLEDAISSGTPVVLLDRRSPGLHADMVGIDNRRAAATPRTCLIEHGHTPHRHPHGRHRGRRRPPPQQARHDGGRAQLPPPPPAPAPPGTATRSWRPPASPPAGVPERQAASTARTPCRDRRRS